MQFQMMKLHEIIEHCIIQHVLQDKQRGDKINSNLQDACFEEKTLPLHRSALIQAMVIPALTILRALHIYFCTEVPAACQERNAS